MALILVAILYFRAYVWRGGTVTAADNPVAYWAVVAVFSSGVLICSLIAIGL